MPIDAGMRRSTGLGRVSVDRSWLFRGQDYSHSSWRSASSRRGCPRHRERERVYLDGDSGGERRLGRRRRRRRGRCRIVQDQPVLTVGEAARGGCDAVAGLDGRGVARAGSNLNRHGYTPECAACRGRRLPVPADEHLQVQNRAAGAGIVCGNRHGKMIRDRHMDGLGAGVGGMIGSDAHRTSRVGAGARIAAARSRGHPAASEC
jgi:hypothetical protein